MGQEIAAKLVMGQRRWRLECSVAVLGIMEQLVVVSVPNLDVDRLGRLGLMADLLEVWQ